jgi:hypothetical protein
LIIRLSKINNKIQTTYFNIASASNPKLKYLHIYHQIHSTIPTTHHPNQATHSKPPTNANNRHLPFHLDDASASFRTAFALLPHQVLNQHLAYHYKNLHSPALQVPPYQTTDKKQDLGY